MPPLVTSLENKSQELDYLCVDDFMKTLVDARALASAFELGLIDYLSQNPRVHVDDLRKAVRSDERGFRFLLDLLIANRVIGESNGDIQFTQSFLRALVKYAKEHPGEIKYGSAGAGTIGHLLMESISMTAGGLKMVHVPYAGTAPALISLAGGHIQVSIGDVPPAIPLMEAKQINLLAITNTQRVKTLANVPALPELGFRGVDVWKALFAPNETPPAVVKHLEKALDTTLKDQNCIAALAKIGQEPDFIGTEKFTPKMMEDDKWLAEIVAKLGLAKK